MGIFPALAEVCTFWVLSDFR